MLTVNSVSLAETLDTIVEHSDSFIAQADSSVGAETWRHIQVTGTRPASLGATRATGSHYARLTRTQTEPNIAEASAGSRHSG